MKRKKSSTTQYNIRLALLFLAAFIVLMLIELVFQMFYNLKNAEKTSEVLIDHVESIIDRNAENEGTLTDSLKEDYIVRARALAYMVYSDPELKYDADRLEVLAEEMSVDEIHIFDDNGTIYAGTVTKYIGINMNDGDQISYFKPMLEDKELEMCQEVTPNTAEGKSMMYAMVWLPDGSGMLQVGVEPVRLLNEISADSIEKVISDMAIYDNIGIIVADADTLEVVASSDSQKTYDSIVAISNKIADSSDDESIYNFAADIAGVRHLCTFRKSGSYYIGIIRAFKDFNGQLRSSLLIVSIYILIASVVIFFVACRLNMLLQKERDAKIALKDNALEGLKRQLSIIEGISRDFMDIMLLDFASQKVHMLKANGKMRNIDDVFEESGTDYNDLCKNYCETFVLSEERADLLEAVKTEKVMEAVRNGNDYMYSCHCLIGAKISTYQLKFININETKSGQELVVGAIRCIDDIIEEQRQHEKLVEEASRDSLTGLLNRNAYEDDAEEFSEKSQNPDFVFVAMDLNGLKVANDSLGHDAGDELLKAAAACMRRCFGSYGNLYRTGGDEFVAVIYADVDKLEEIKKDFERECAVWKGEMSSDLSVSCGYVSRSEFPDMPVKEMSRLADKRMYAAKNEYYISRGIDRRGTRRAATIK